MSRGVLVLLLLAAGLGLYLWLVEMPAQQKRTETEAASKKLLDFKEDDVRAVTITSTQGKLEIVREQDGRWAITAPKTLEAEPLAVEDFLRTFLLAKISRVVEESAADFRAYGLADPVLTVSFRLASGTQTIRLGDPGPLSSTLYAAREGSPQVLLTTLSSQDVLAKGVQAFRRQHILAFDRNRVTRLKIARPAETVVLYKEGHGEKAPWMIKTPVETAADQPEVRSLLIGLEDLKATGFVDDPSEQAEIRARLGPPLATVTMREGESDRTVTLWIDPRNQRQAFAESGAKEPLYRIAPGVAHDLAKGLFALRNKQLIAAEPEQVRTLVVKAGGRDFSLTHAGADWLIDGDPNRKADAAKLNMFVSRLVRLQAERIVSDKPTDLRSVGLAPPATELIATDAQGKPLGRIAFGREEGGLIYAQGTAMIGVFQVRPDILKEIPPRENTPQGKTQP